jgi:hypothetical protein
MDDQRSVSVLFLKENTGWWVALWLEKNMAAQDHNIKDAWRALQNVVAGQLELDKRRGRVPFEGKSPAPLWYWQAYTTAKPLPDGYLDADSNLFDHGSIIEPRQYALAA